MIFKLCAFLDNSLFKDFQHLLDTREDNHKFIEHLFMDRLKFEAELIEKLEKEIEQLKSLTLKQCPNCGIRRPKRYHRLFHSKIFK